MWKSFSSLIFLVTLLSALSVQGQESTTYSRFGLGLVSQQNFIESRAMGGLGASFRSEESVNYANPASYAHLNLISFEGGVSGSINRVASNFNTGRTGSINLAYLTLAMPIKKDLWVSSIGIIPFSQKQYLVADTLSLSDNQSVTNVFEGEGTLYSVYWGNGFKYKDLALGFNIGYLFGSIDGTDLTVPLDADGFTDPYSFTTIERNTLRASGVLWNIGAQYSIPLQSVEYGKNLFKELRMDVGVAYNANYKIGNNNRVEESKYSLYSSILPTKNEQESFATFIDDILVSAAEAESLGADNVDVDTFLAPNSRNLALRMPMNLNMGFTFVKTVRNINFWKAGFDFRWTPWSNYSGYESGAGGDLSNSWRVAAGGEIFPLGSARNTSTIKSKIFSQMKYRAGFYYERTPVTIQSTPIDEFGINFGIAIPIRLRLVNDDGYYGFRAVHPFSLGFEIGSRGTKSNNLIRDNFVRINFGISLNDKWFVKRKYN